MTVPSKPKAMESIWKRLCSFINHLLSLIIRIEYHSKCEVCLSDKTQNCLSRKTYDQVYITDSDEVHQWASKDTYMFRLFIFLQKYRLFRYILNGSHDINPAWQYVLWADDVIDERKLINVTDTLIVHCRSIESYGKLIPYIRGGSYSRLVLHGHIHWHQVKQLVRPWVKEVRINASFDIHPLSYDYEKFTDYILEHCRGAEYKFTLADEAHCPAELELKLHDAIRSHKSHYIMQSKRANHLIDHKCLPIYFGNMLLLTYFNFALFNTFVAENDTVVFFFFFFNLITFFILSDPVPMDVKNDEHVTHLTDANTNIFIRTAAPTRVVARCVWYTVVPLKTKKIHVVSKNHGMPAWHELRDLKSTNVFLLKELSDLGQDGSFAFPVGCCELKPSQQMHGSREAKPKNGLARPG
uniref:Metallophos domain-containing protein n=1 Tax=Panagrellus redivivus TaxID=6233 RepID=A0A7E4UXW9_PANRE